MNLQYEEREAIINYRIEKADKAYQEAMDVAPFLPKVEILMDKLKKIIETL